MKSEELRIGNFIKVNRFGFELEASLTKGSEIDNCEIDNYKPVKLTEEWLFKFGFEIRTQVESQIYYILNSVEISWDELDNCFCFKRSLLKFIDIKYVHQLQNLYFALTGKELNLK